MPDRYKKDKYMKYTLSILLFCILMFLVPLQGSGFDLGADIYNRYVWRGTDFGNTPAVQPYINYSIGGLEVGAWSSWSITGASGGNENDLYASYSYNNFSLTVTDYFFPGYTGDDGIDEFSESGAHTVELSAGYSFADLSFLAAINVLGNDSDNSKYVEVNYEFYTKKNLAANVFIGAGDYIYTQDNNFTVVNLGLSVSRGRYNAAYIINPDQRTSFLTFGIAL
ncbi:MAG TPA: hypothetical protein VKP78_00985 [bacterium]|nr:hypothetical protein [bacterium]